MNKALFHQ